MNNPNYNNNFNGNNFTFQNNLHFLSPILRPPPPPPTIFNPLVLPISDQDYVKSFENKLQKVDKVKRVTKCSLSKLKEKISTLNLAYNNIKIQKKKLNENINVYSEEQWQNEFKEVENNKLLINNLLSELSGSYLDLSRRALAKRSAKRLRLKRLSENTKKEKQQQVKEREERSRIINENLKKINDDIQKAKQVEEAKQLADIVLKDVRRKRHEAKKNINKLDALVKLRKSRQNTAKGRGVNVCENEATAIQEHIEKLKQLWIQKLTVYDIEESELRASLNQSNSEESTDKTEKEVIENLKEWHRVMFGGAISPQVDFQGDVQKFVHIRSEWDRYISISGTPIPMAWVLPAR